MGVPEASIKTAKGLPTNTSKLPSAGKERSERVLSKTSLSQSDEGSGMCFSFKIVKPGRKIANVEKQLTSVHISCAKMKKRLFYM